MKKEEQTLKTIRTKNYYKVSENMLEMTSYSEIYKSNTNQVSGIRYLALYSSYKCQQNFCWSFIHLIKSLLWLMYVAIIKAQLEWNTTSFDLPPKLF